MNSLILKIVIAVICTVLIVLLAFFGDIVISDPNYVISNGHDDSAYSDMFTFDPEVITYDGKSDLDLLEGVSLKGLSSQDLKTMVFTQIYSGDTLSEKVIQYTADTEDGRVRSTRKLCLRNYNGPKILLPDEIPTVIPETVDGFGSLLKTRSDYAVDDGFGNDMRDYVDVRYEEDTQDSSLLHYTIEFNNLLGDWDIVKTDVVLSGVPARIVLTDAEITVSYGEDFDPKAYIQSAEMENGENAIDRVFIQSNLDTKKRGTYDVSYEIAGRKAVLVVNVE